MLQVPCLRLLSLWNAQWIKVTPLCENITCSINLNCITNSKFPLLHKRFNGILFQKNIKCIVIVMSFKRAQTGQHKIR